jgi:hypothetical protein
MRKTSLQADASGSLQPCLAGFANSLPSLREMHLPNKVSRKDAKLRKARKDYCAGMMRTLYPRLLFSKALIPKL